MASVATLTYSAQHAVTVNWGDGSPVESYAAAPPPATATVHHMYATQGPWTVTITDTVNLMASNTQVTCSTCDITGATLHNTTPTTGAWTIGPIVNGAGTSLNVNWGDGSVVDVVASGASGAHTYISANGSGPFTVVVTDPAVPGCQAAVTGGNRPGSPNGAALIVPPVLALTCTGGDAVLSDVVHLTITGFGSTYTVDWGDGTATEQHPSGTWNHTYARPVGLLRTVTVTEVSTGFSGVVTSQCEIAPIISSLVCNFVANCTKLPAGQITTTNTQPMQATWTATATGNYTVDWGDGTAVDTVNSGTGKVHTYAANGTYNIIWALVGNTSCADNHQVVIPVP